MKNPIEILKAIPKECREIFFFVVFVMAGSIFKMMGQKERGVKFTFARLLVETFMSFFIAMIVYAVIDQFFHFNMLFTLAICSLAGSISSKLFHSKLEELVTACFDGAKEKVNQYLKVKKNEQ